MRLEGGSGTVRAWVARATLWSALPASDWHLERQHGLLLEETEPGAIKKAKQQDLTTMFGDQRLVKDKKAESEIRDLLRSVESGLIMDYFEGESEEERRSRASLKYLRHRCELVSNHRIIEHLRCNFQSTSGPWTKYLKKEVTKRDQFIIN